MKAYKKVISLLLTVLMLLSCFAVGAGAASWGLTEILEDYQEADATYYEPFDTEDAATGFGTVENGTLNYDSENGRLHIEKAATEADVQTKLTKTLDAALTTNDNMCYFEFDTFGTAGFGLAEYRLNGGNTQVRFYINWDDGKVSARTPENVRRNVTTVDKSVAHKVKILLDYDADLFYVWLDDNSEPVIDGWGFYNENTTDNTSTFVILSSTSMLTGDLYIDNFKITPMILFPEATNGYLYQEDFNSYTTGNINTTLKNNPDDTLKNLANASGVLDTDGAGNYGSGVAYLEICEEGTDDKALKMGTGETTQHMYYYSRACDFSNIGNNLVIQAQFKMDTGAMWAVLGDGSYNSAKVFLKINDGSITVGEKVKGETGAQVAYQDDYVDGKYHTITYMLDKGTGTYGKCSLWIDGNLYAENVDCYQGITGGFPNSIGFRRGDVNTVAYVDDIRVFVPSESFLNVFKIRSSVTELSDICSVGTDTYVTDYLGTDTIKTNVGLTENTSTTVVFADSEGYFDGTNIIFPLYADTADLVAKISDGTISAIKRFYNVTIPAAYSNIVKNPAETVTATENFAAGTITADVRNSASNIAGRIKVLAAVYDGTELIKVQMQDDVFTDGKINCTMDLSDAEVPDGAIVKLFIWDGASLTPLA